MKKQYTQFLLVTLLLFGLNREVYAQYDLDRPARTLRADDGIPNYYFRGLEADAFGFVWMASYDGLSRFDGSQIEVFRHRQDDSLSLAHNAIMGLSADPLSGKVWVATYGGLSVYEPATGYFKSYRNTENDSTSIINNFINWVYVDRQGEVWVASGGDILCRYDPLIDGFQRYYPRAILEGVQQNGEETREKILTVSQDLQDDNLIWIATNYRFFSFNKQEHTFDYSHPELPNIRRILPFPDGKLYLADAGGELLVYHPGERELSWQGRPAVDWQVSRLFIRSPESIWLSCNKGIAVMDVTDGSFSYPWINEPAAEKSYKIDLIDPEGRIWSAGTSGVKIFDPLNVQFKNNICDLPGGNRAFIPQAITEDEQRHLLYLTANPGDGVYRFDRKKDEWSLIPPPSDYEGEGFFGFGLAMGKDGELIILESIELFTLSDDGQSMRVHPLSSTLPEGRIWVDFLVDSKGNIWLGNRKDGVWKIDAATGTAESLEQYFPGCDRMRYRYAFFEDSRHNIWISGCSGFGYYSYEQDDFVLLPYQEGQTNANTFKRARDFEEDSQGIIWVSNEEAALLGQIRVDRPEEGIFQKLSLRHLVDVDSARVVKKSDEDILDVSKFAIDQEDNIWTISSTGLLKYNPTLQRIEIYNDQDGLQWRDEQLNVVTVNQIEQLSTGELAVAFRKGMSVFDPGSLQWSRETPRPYLKSFKVYNNEWSSDSSLFLTRSISLEAEENYFSFEFSAIGYTRPENYRFQYRLIGLDDDWIEANERRYVGYTNVKGGSYTFEVRVANSAGEWNNEHLNIQLYVATPWYLQWWFQSSLLTLLLASGYLYYRYRLKQVRETERVRTEFENQLAQVELTALRAQMNPHFLFNCLNSIDYFILKNETRKASEYLQDFSRLIRLILQNSRSHYVNLKDELEALTLYVEMEKLRFNQRFGFEIDVDEAINLEDTEIPPMLIQPFVENAIWHGLMHKEDGGSVKIQIFRDRDLLHCIIEDNGIGRKRAAELKTKNQRKKSMGMSITRERINIINRLYKTDTSIQITDLVDPEGEVAGTRVELAILV